MYLFVMKYVNDDGSDQGMWWCPIELSNNLSSWITWRIYVLSQFIFLDNLLVAL